MRVRARTFSQLRFVLWLGVDVRLEPVILALYERVKVDIIDVTRSQHGVRALDYIFRQPVFGSAQFVEGSEIPKATAQRFIVLLRDAGLLHTARPRQGRRGGIYVFTELIEVVEGRSLR